LLENAGAMLLGGNDEGKTLFSLIQVSYVVIVIMYVVIVFLGVLDSTNHARL
jgi:hypothetical protein